MNITPKTKASILGYLLTIACLYSIVLVLNVISIQFFGAPPVDTKASGSMGVTWFMLIAVSVIVGRYFGSMSYLGIAICVFFFTVAIPQMISTHILKGLIPEASREVAQITMTTPWYNLILPSLVTVTALFAYNYITKKLTSRVSHAGRT
jgi:hypothetical protein